MLKDETDEGTRSFAFLLQQIGDGTLHGQASDELRRVVSELSALAQRVDAKVKGGLTIKLSLSAKPNGTVEVDGVVEAKLPKPRAAGQSVFWISKGGNLSVDNPRQQRLPLREVTPPPREAAIVAELPKPVHGV